MVLRPHINTLALAVAGAGLFWALGLPLPFLFGPMAATLLGAFARQELAAFSGPSTAARAVIGVAVGTTVTPELFESLPRVAASVALVPFYLVMIAAVGIPFFRKVHRLDAATAFFATMPGGLPDMVAYGQEAGGNVRALSLIHVTRVVILLSVALPLVRYVYDAPITGAVGSAPGEVPLVELGLMAAAAVIGTVGGKRVGLFGAAILGPLLISAALSLSGLIEHRPPRDAVIAAQFVMGMSIGVHYVNLSVRELREYVLSGVAFSILLAILTAVFAEVVTRLGLAPSMEAFLAFAPGGQAELTVLAIAVGADVTYIVPHHLIRVILILSGAPVAARLMGIRLSPRR